jgi:hypothetical protein
MHYQDSDDNNNNNNTFFQQDAWSEGMQDPTPHSPQVHEIFQMLQESIIPVYPPFSFNDNDNGNNNNNNNNNNNTNNNFNDINTATTHRTVGERNEEEIIENLKREHMSLFYQNNQILAVQSYEVFSYHRTVDNPVENYLQARDSMKYFEKIMKYYKRNPPAVKYVDTFTAFARFCDIDLQSWENNIYDFRKKELIGLVNEFCDNFASTIKESYEESVSSLFGQTKGSVSGKRENDEGAEEGDYGNEEGGASEGKIKKGVPSIVVDLDYYATFMEKMNYPGLTYLYQMVKTIHYMTNRVFGRLSASARGFSTDVENETDENRTTTPKKTKKTKKKSADKQRANEGKDKRKRRGRNTANETEEDDRMENEEGEEGEGVGEEQEEEKEKETERERTKRKGIISYSEEVESILKRQPFKVNVNFSEEDSIVRYIIDNETLKASAYKNKDGANDKNKNRGIN